MILVSSRKWLVTNIISSIIIITASSISSAL